MNNEHARGSYYLLHGTYHAQEPLQATKTLSLPPKWLLRDFPVRKRRIAGILRSSFVNVSYQRDILHQRYQYMGLGAALICRSAINQRLYTVYARSTHFCASLMLKQSRLRCRVSGTLPQRS